MSPSNGVDVNGTASEQKTSIIVTGGASGIGLAITRYFAAAGHNIAVLDVNAAQGPSIVESVANEHPNAKLTFWQCNVTSWQEQATVFKKVFDQHGGRLDVVMANAGISERGTSDMVAIEATEPLQPRLDTINVNLVGVMYSVKLAFHYMNKNQYNHTSSRGSIVCTASNAGVYPFPIAPVYAATKSGVIGLVRSLAQPYAKSNVQINALAPAVLETNIAPDPALFKGMVLTPFETLTRGVGQFIDDPSITGAVAEIHGDHVTIRPPPEFVDEDSAKNLETFWNLGYA